jgi:hypothetical protein
MADPDSSSAHCERGSHSSSMSAPEGTRRGSKVEWCRSVVSLSTRCLPRNTHTSTYPTHQPTGRSTSHGFRHSYSFVNPNHQLARPSLGVALAALSFPYFPWLPATTTKAATAGQPRTPTPAVSPSCPFPPHGLGGDDRIFSSSRLVPLSPSFLHRPDRSCPSRSVRRFSEACLTGTHIFRMWRAV